MMAFVNLISILELSYFVVKKEINVQLKFFDNNIEVDNWLPNILKTNIQKLWFEIMIAINLKTKIDWRKNKQYYWDTNLYINLSQYFIAKLF